MSDASWPYQLYPARILLPWDSLGNNTGVGCHILLFNPEIKRTSLISPALVGRFFNTSTTWEAIYIVGGKANWCSTMENNMQVSWKTKNRVTIWSSNPSPGNISGKDGNSNLKRYIYPNVQCNIIYNNQVTWMSTGRWLDKWDVV